MSQEVGMHKRRVVDARSLGVFVLQNRFIDDGWIAKLGPHATVVYLFLVRHAAEGSEPPTVQKIREQTGVSERQIYRSVRALIKADLLELVSRGNQVKGANVYRVLDLDSGKAVSYPEAPKVQPEKASGTIAKGDAEAQFEQAWKLYPKRPNNPKQAALRAWRARIKEGVSPLVMIEGVKQYAAYVEKSGTEPKYVKMASTFFGPDHHFSADFTTDEPKAKPATGRAASEEDLLGYYEKEVLV